MKNSRNIHKGSKEIEIFTLKPTFQELGECQKASKSTLNLYATFNILQHSIGFSETFSSVVWHHLFQEIIHISMSDYINLRARLPPFCRGLKNAYEVPHTGSNPTSAKICTFFQDLVLWMFTEKKAILEILYCFSFEFSTSFEIFSANGFFPSF